MPKQYLSLKPSSYIISFWSICLVYETEFYLASRGSLRCPIGKAIMDEKTCKQACKALNVPQIQILGNNLCYKDHQGNCYQNGINGAGASLICTKYGELWKWYYAQFL